MYQKHYGLKETPQTRAIPGKDQVKDSAGGYVFAVDDWVRLDRFLILGAEGGSYYAGEMKLTIENAEAVARCIKEDGPRVVDRTEEISKKGRAAKNDPALFVMAMCAGMGDAQTRKLALLYLPNVARIGTHLFQFLEYAKAFRGWGRGMRQAVAAWYNDKEPKDLAYQVVKYRQRHRWTHRDVLRQAHPVPATKEHKHLYHWITQGKIKKATPPLIEHFEMLQAAKNAEEAWITLSMNKSLPWETVPSEFLKSPQVWRGLLPRMPLTALIRNLGRMTANGALKPMSKETELVCEKLCNADALKRSRIHPLSILVALKTYESGKGVRGSLEWDPVAMVVDALDGAFYLAFGNVEASSRRLMLALDVSSSMRCSEISRMPGITPRIGSAAMALITAKVEPNHCFVGFTSAGHSGWRTSAEIKPLPISSRQRLDDVVKAISGLPFGGTDCALPMLYALKQELKIDTFVIYTDSETWAGGRVHPVQALDEYRRKTGIPAKLVICGMVSNGFSIADPSDAGMLDCVGFDLATPRLISDFA